MLKEQVYHANMELVKKKIVIYTWGNASAIDRESGLVVIKPSGVPYDKMTPADMVVLDLNSGKVLEGDLKPSSDTPTHLELYKAFDKIGGVVHTHSTNAVAFAQAGMDIPALGTTHADYFYGSIPCTREMLKEEVETEYEKNTGKVLIETVQRNDVLDVPGILVKNHGPFTWGKNVEEAVYHSVVLEQVAKMAYMTLQINPESNMEKYLLEKHFMRKHGKDAYYGQKNVE